MNLPHHFHLFSNNNKAHNKKQLKPVVLLALAHWPATPFIKLNTFIMKTVLASRDLEIPDGGMLLISVGMFLNII